jgi:hypothetical protein
MNKYNFIERLLHNLCFKFKFINKSLFELEKIFYCKKIDLEEIQNQKHIFISGLPRSGTTSILNHIYSSNDYASLTYRNMPFLFSPNLTSKINIKKNSTTGLRAHNDRIKYNISSPEAFDEVFLNSYNNENLSYEFLNYIFLILKLNNKKKYLSKNNNNYKRINFFKKIFPLSKFLIPYREPLQHANSLLNQHKNFIKIHNEDSFTLKYMNFLGHYEFGKNHIPWFKPKMYFNYLDLNYWLEQWVKFYENILNIYDDDKKNIKILSYDKLCEPEYLKLLNEYLDIDNNNLGSFDILQKEVNQNYDKKLYFKAIVLYEKLNNFAK